MPRVFDVSGAFGFDRAPNTPALADASPLAPGHTLVRYVLSIRRASKSSLVECSSPIGNELARHEASGNNFLQLVRKFCAAENDPW